MIKTTKSKVSKSLPTERKKSTVRRVKDHDIFVRGILSINVLVLKILLHYIPKNIHPFIDFSTLKIFTDMQIDNKLKSIQADSIHECALNIQQLPEPDLQQAKFPLFRFCFLWEHKSSKPDEPIEFQIEAYRQGIIRGDLKNQQIPSIVIPLLLYHGEEKWEKKLLYEQVEAFLPPELLAFIPYPKYIEIDLQAMSVQEIEDSVDLEELRAAFVALKYGHDKDFFKQDIKKVLKFVKEIPDEYLYVAFFKMLMEYMERRSQLEKEAFNDIVEQNLETEMATKKVFKTSYEIVAEEAEARGEARGEVKILRKAIVSFIRTTSFSNAQIAKELDADEAFVAAIRQEFMALQPQA
jgi:hypothetical protein